MIDKIKKLRTSIWMFFFTQAIVPFETVFAFYCIYGGLSGLLKLGLVSENFTTVLGETAATIFNIWYIIAGACLYFGVGKRRRDIEVFGLVSIVTSLLVRMIAINWLSGFDSRIFGLYIVNTAFMTACLVRIWTLFNFSFSLQVMTKPTIESTKSVVGILAEKDIK